MSDCGRWDGPDFIVELLVTARAGREGLTGLREGRLAVRLAAAPVDGAANAALLRLLAGVFGVAQREVSLLRGARGRRKCVRIRRPTRFPPEIGPPPVR